MVGRGVSLVEEALVVEEAALVVIYMIAYPELKHLLLCTRRRKLQIWLELVKSGRKLLNLEEGRRI